MTESNIAIICFGDEGYFSKPPFAPIIALTSFRRVFGDEVDYFCVGRFENRDTIRLIERNGLKALNVDFSDTFSRGQQSSFWGSFPPEGFYLGTFPGLFLERGYQCCLVVDGDVYCNMRFDIENLIADADIGAIRQHPDFHINSGVLLLKNERCLEKKFFERFVELYRTNEYWSEQPLLNDLIEAHDFDFRELDLTYNFTLRAKNLLYESENGQRILNARPEEVKIAHFLRGKPWVDQTGSKFDYPIRNHFAKLYMQIPIETP